MPELKRRPVRHFFFLQNLKQFEKVSDMIPLKCTKGKECAQHLIVILVEITQFSIVVLSHANVEYSFRCHDELGMQKKASGLSRLPI